MSLLADQNIMVTGGAGFLGTQVCRELEAQHPKSIFVPRSLNYDLRERTAIEDALNDSQANIVIHLAAVVGGIGANRLNAGRFFYENAIMGIQLMEASRLAGIKKFVGVGTICSYPKFTPVPFQEADLWSGYPEETNAPYGIAKKMLLVQAQAYRQQYGFNAIHLLPVNLYGPRDNFDPDSSHVIPALIRKVVEAQEQGQPEISAWGTGSASREFIYVDDAARGIVLATEHYDSSEPLNLGTGREITIANLTELICELCEYSGTIRWDASKPDGQPRRCLDVTRARETIGFEARMDFREGLRRTIDWYRETRTPAVGDTRIPQSR